jgi:peroxiredoxin Q/BCP
LGCWLALKKTEEKFMVKVGENAPGFVLSDADGNKVTLDDFKGKKVVLFFYPKDDTPG